MNTKTKNDTVISVRTNTETSTRLSRLAKVTSRSKSYLVHQALEQYLEQEEAFVAAVAEGIADAEAGKLYSDDEIARTLETLISKASKDN